MTYKHIKFSESEVMRSLEKVAFDKGLIQNKHKKMVDLIVKKSQFTSDYSEEEPQFTPGSSEDPFNLGFRSETAEEAYERSLRQEEAKRTGYLSQSTLEENVSQQSIPYGYTKQQPQLSSQQVADEQFARVMEIARKNRETAASNETKEFYKNVKRQLDNYLYGTPIDPKAIIWTYHPSLKNQLEQGIKFSAEAADRTLEILSMSPEPITGTIGGVYMALKCLSRGDNVGAAMQLLFTIPGMRAVGSLAKMSKAGWTAGKLAQGLRAVPKATATAAVNSLKQTARGVFDLSKSPTLKEIANDIAGTLAQYKIQSEIAEMFPSEDKLQERGKKIIDEQQAAQLLDCRQKYASQLAQGFQQALSQMSNECSYLVGEYEKNEAEALNQRLSETNTMPIVVSDPKFADRLKAK